MNYSQGSDWRKWDLHLHTPSSHDYKNKAVTNHDIINTLADNGISAVAITDHHIIDIARIKELQTLGSAKNITVFPGIEILSDARGEDPLHILGIFPEDSKIEYIWAQLENTTNLKKIKGENKKIDEVYCDLEETIKLIKELGGLISIHAGKKSNSIECITNSLAHTMAQKADIAKNVHFYELGQETDQKGYNEVVFPFLKKRIPMVICSDNHNIKDYKLKQKCWIKADTTFNGLRQIIFEPDTRVKIQNDKPDYKKDYLTIDKVRFIDKTGKFQPDYISLNNNLNSIIGGKSSGKSLLLYFIAKTIAPKAVEDINTHFTQNNKVFGYDINDADFEVVWKDGKKQLLSQPDELNRPISYVPQLYINEIAENTKDRVALNNLILEILNEKDIYRDFNNSKLRDLQKEKDELSLSISKFFNLSDNIFSKQKEINELGDKQATIDNVEKLKGELELLRKESDFSLEDEKSYKELFAKKEELSQIRQNQEISLSNFSRLKIQLQEYLVSPKEHFFQSGFTKLQESFKTDKELSLLLRILEENLTISIRNSINSFLQLAFKSRQDYNQSELTKYNDLLIKTIQEIKPYDEKLKNQEKFQKTQKEIEEENLKIQKIEIKEKELAAIKEDQAKIDLINIYSRIFNNYNERIYKNVEFKTIDENIELISCVSFNNTTFDSNFSSKISKKSPLQNQFSSDFFDGNNFIFNPSKHIENIKAIYSTLLNENIPLNLGNDIKDAIAGLLHDCFAVEFDLNQGGDHLLQMSPGKRGLVLFQLFLKLSNSVYPVLIDQPEDSLDNRTVFTQLNDFIKLRKQNRQIIMVSHNANLVVSTDSENVIVANQHGQNKESNKKAYDFEYISGALELSFEDTKETGVLFSKGIREHVCEVLEGGEEAFLKREKKYGFA